MDALFIERIIILILMVVTGSLLLKGVYRLVRFLMKYKKEHGYTGLAFLIAGAVLALWGAYRLFVFIEPYLVYILAAIVGYFWFTGKTFKNSWRNNKTSSDDEFIREWEREWDIADINRRNGF